MTDEMKRFSLWKACHMCGEGGHIIFEEPFKKHDGQDSRVVGADGCWHFENGEIYHRPDMG